MKTKVRRNALIGLAFIASLVMIYFGINFLKGVNVLKKQNQYYALFDDVSSLLISSPIYVKGFQIGLINKIEMVSENPMRFSVGVNLTTRFGKEFPWKNRLHPRPDYYFQP